MPLEEFYPIEKGAKKCVFGLKPVSTSELKSLIQPMDFIIIITQGLPSFNFLFYPFEKVDQIV